MIWYLSCGVGFGALYQVGRDLGLDTGGGLSMAGDGCLALVFYVGAVLYIGFIVMLCVIGTGTSWATGASENACSGSSTSSEKSEYELRVRADGRVTRKCPSLENVSIGV